MYGLGLAVNDERPVTKGGMRRVVLLAAVVEEISEESVVRDETALSNAGCSGWSDYASRTPIRGVSCRPINC